MSFSSKLTRLSPPSSYGRHWISVYTNTVIDEWFVGDFSSASYHITVDFDSNQKETMQVLVVARPDYASYTIFGRTSIQNELITLSATVTASKLYLTASSTSNAFNGAKVIFTANYAETINQLSVPTTIPGVPASVGTLQPLRSELGFVSPGFTVDLSGNVDITGEFKINGESIALSITDTLPSTYVYSSLTQLGTLTALTVSGNTSFTNGTLTVSSAGAVSITSGTTGSLNNVAIGNNTASTGAFTNLTADTSTILSLTATTTTATNITAVNLSNTGTLNINPATAGAINNVNIGYSTPGTGKFTTLTITTTPSNTTDATTKKYVDTRSLAMAIALGS